MIIATYNTEFLFDVGEHQHSGKSWTYATEFVDERVRKIANLLKQINADIVLLQEVGSKSVVQKIIKQADMGYQAFFGNPDRFGVGNAALHRLPATNLRSIPTVAPLPVFSSRDTDVLSPRITSRRDFVYLTVLYRDSPLYIIGAHLKANFPVGMNGRGDVGFESQLDAADGLIRSELTRMSQAKKLRQTVDEILADDPQAYVVVAGDFNCPADSSYKIIRGVEQNRSGSLWNNAESVDNTKRYTCITPNGTLQEVDHILCTQNLRQHVSKTIILNEHLVGHKNTAPYMGSTDSDHAPVVIELI